MYCSKCGKQIEDDAQFCRYCGYNLNSNSQESTQNYNGFGYIPVNSNNYETYKQDVFRNQVIYGMQDINKSVKESAYSAKSPTVAGFLAIFLGLLGIHNFYVNKKLRAGIQLGIFLVAVFGGVFSFLTYIAMFLLFPVWIWNIIEAVIFFSGNGVDGYGKPMKKDPS